MHEAWWDICHGSCIIMTAMAAARIILLPSTPTVVGRGRSIGRGSPVARDLNPSYVGIFVALIWFGFILDVATTENVTSPCLRTGYARIKRSGYPGTIVVNT